MSDLIRRSDAIEFAKYTHIASLNEEERVAWIMNIPTAEPKRGEWIETQYTDCGASVYKCSECELLVSDIPIVLGKPIYNFCPNCGADMRKEGE